jgi:simple sugar transport system permease protein/ribose transport system permease protein
LVGGTAIQGGSGSPLNTAFAAIFVALVQNYVALHGYSFGVQLFVEGVVVCVAVVGFWLLKRPPA